MDSNLFIGRKILIVTKHKKEKVIAPIMENILGVACVLNETFDTDKLGTFTGEINRIKDPLDTARDKCIMALEDTPYDMAIANEGSFGPHHSLPFVHADDEIIYFIDVKNKLEIFSRVVSTETNFRGAEIKSKNELKEFAKAAQFPSHALIIRKAADDYTDIVKGITDWNILNQQFDRFMEDYGGVYIETDMRAMYNPTRMNVIKAAAEKLANKINTYCPNCHTPGFGITAIKEGLQCEHCNMPTKSILSYIYSCQQCDFEKEELKDEDKKYENPMYCDYCNP